MKVAEKQNLGIYTFQCPGCGHIHQLHTKDRNYSNALWGFNGDINNPIFTPSLLVRTGKYVDGKDDEGYGYLCHSFIREGRMEFLSDCTHENKNKTLLLPDLDEEFVTNYSR